jgi:hypothetical protein
MKGSGAISGRTRRLGLGAGADLQERDTATVLSDPPPQARHYLAAAVRK